MKKFLLSSITLVSLFIVGCDTNVYQPILINQDFILNKVSDSKINHTTDTITGTTKKITETFTHSVVGNKLILTNTFAYGNPGEIATNGISTFDNSTSLITLTYRDSLGLNPLYIPGTTTPIKKGAEIKSTFDISQVRKGTGKKLKVKIVYVFPNSNTNVANLQSKTIDLPY
jgi:hypothetical protein